MLTFDADPPQVVKAHLDPSFCCLSFPKEYHRARKNSVDLFPQVVGELVSEVRMFNNERCFSIHFGGSKALLFKMHGNRANVILFDNETKQLFKNNLKNDQNIELGTLDRALDQSYQAFAAANADYKKLFPTFGPVITARLKAEGFDHLELDHQWDLVDKLVEEIEQGQYFLVKLNGQLHLSLVRTGEVLESLQDPIEALNAFFLKKITTGTLESERGKAVTQVEREIKKAKNYIETSSKKLRQITGAVSYSHLGDILMANLYNIDPSLPEVTLPNFYNDNQPVTIKLKKDLSPQKNAEVYYRKSKNQSREIDILTKNIERKKDQLATWNTQRQELINAKSLKTLREIYKQQPDTPKETGTKPYRSQHFEGFDIWIGKNARSNDEMLRNHSHKEDLWLHAKDVSGSHVLIKYSPGKTIPAFVIERAAELAAYHSKRKQDSVCPVIYTPRKFVRKRKGDPPGAVVVEREKVILVKPNH